MREVESRPPGIIIQPLGAPGIGKDFITRALHLTPITRVTTRPARAEDPHNGVLPLTEEEFMRRQAEFFAIHEPLADGHLYGWDLDPVKAATTSGRHLSADFNVHLLEQVATHPVLANRGVRIGILSDPSYRESNITEGRYMGQRLTPAQRDDLNNRIEIGQQTQASIIEAHRNGGIHQLIHLDDRSRPYAVSIFAHAVKDARQRLGI